MKFSFFTKQPDSSRSSKDKQHSVFEVSMRRSIRFTVLAAVLAIGILIYFMLRYQRHMDDYHANQDTYLPAPSSHQQSPLFGGQHFPGVNENSLFTLLDSYTKLESEKANIRERLESYRLPFDSFLRYVYLPSLNVWKDPFVGSIDTELMGAKFLETNPYTDISLINQWTDFFKSMGSDTYNEINSITVGDIVEEDDYFYIPLQVSFTAPSRRAFLFLLDKVSLTSDKNNIMLVNEFFYHLWESIKKSDTLDPYLEEMIQENGLDITLADATRDKLLGYALMHRKDGSISSLPFLTNEIIHDAITHASGCRNGASDDICEFQFREKFRSIPRLAYGLGYRNVSENDLLYFLSDVPPILVLDNFTFEKSQSDSLGGDFAYEGEVSVKVYGQGISSAEVDDIAEILGIQCFGADANQRMDISYGLSLVQKKLLEDVDPTVVSLQRSKDLLELQGLLSDMATDYEGLTSYKKSIRLFETYRMLDDALFCP